MSVPINIKFDEVLKIIKNLNDREKQQISELLQKENVFTNKHLEESISRKRLFEAGEIESESWQDIKKRLLS